MYEDGNDYKTIGKMAERLFKINGTAIEGLIDQVLFAKTSVSGAIWVCFMCYQSHFGNEERLPQDIALAQC